DITRGRTTLGELVRSHPMAQRALTAMDRRIAATAEPAPAAEESGS
ncbi:hyaluronate lyase, partial [Streptomyces sp. B21-106]